jgi:membrane-associated phospholipid phosphatase
MLRYWFAAACSAVGFVLTYALFVHTPTGQRWDDAALSGRANASPEALRTAEVGLDQITVTTLGVAIAVLLLIALVRGRVLLGLGAASLVVGSLVIAEVLKRAVLERPALVESSADLAHNSFPSGHTTIAVSLMLAMTMVVPYGLRPWAALLTAAWGVGISGYTVTAGWHRPSDAIGAALLAVGVACAVMAVLSSAGRAHVTRPPGLLSSLVRQVAVVPIWLTTTAGLVLGAYLGLVSVRQLDDPTVSAATVDHNAYLGGEMLAVGTSAAAVLALLVLLHRVDVGAVPSHALGEAGLSVSRLTPAGSDAGTRLGRRRRIGPVGPAPGR